MSKISRFNGNLLAFGINATGTNRTIFGGITQSDALDDNLNIDYFTGWEIVGVNENPTREDFNALGFTHGQILAYLHQMGVPEWNTNQEYHTGSFASIAGVLYESQTDSNTGNDPTVDNATNWLPLKDNRITVATITPASDADVTLTRDEYSAEVLVLTDGAWTAAHSIIVPNAPRLYCADNSAGTYDALIKTSAGSGVTIAAGAIRIIYCDNTNVVTTLDSTLSARRLVTNNTSSIYSGYWTLISRMTLTNQYDSVQERLLLTENVSSQAAPVFAEIEYRAKQQYALGNDPLLGLTVLDTSSQSLRPDDFTLVIVQNTPSTIVDLYVRIRHPYMGFQGWVSSQATSDTGSIEHLSNQPFVASISPNLVGSWNPLGDNAVGTVSQSSNIPTGAIIERGSNANGEYVRFADGTQICTYALSGVSVTTAEGSIYTSSTVIWTYPATFAGTSADITNCFNVPDLTRWAVGHAIDVGTAYFRQKSAVSNATSILTSAVAIGRWF